MKDYISNIISTKNPKVYNIFFKQIPIDKLIAETMFLPIDCLPGQRLYHIHNSLSSIPTCPICNDTNMWKGSGLYSLAGYQKTCGNKDCLSLYRKTINSPSQNVTRKYGVDNISQTQEWRDKVKETNLERRGVEWNTQDKKFIERSNFVRSENKESVLNKRIETNLKKYGTKYAIQNSSIKEKQKLSMKNSDVFNYDRIIKSKTTNFSKYGGWFCASVKCQDKKYQLKEYVFPSGNKVFIQGYENKCIDELLHLGYEENNIIVGNLEIEKYVGTINYFTKDGVKHRYYPDIYIVSENRLIEVKSTYTRSLSVDVQLLKENACLTKGFSFITKTY